MAAPIIDPNHAQFTNLVLNEQNAIVFLQTHGLLAGNNYTGPCWIPNCALANNNVNTTYVKVMNTTRDGVFIVLRCKKCMRMRSLRSGVPGHVESWFAGQIDRLGRANTKLSYCQILKLLYYWCKGYDFGQIADLSGVHRNTVTDWSCYIRQICIEDQQNAAPIGGPGQEVQIDESCMRGKRKYNRGRLLGGNLIPGNVGRNHGNAIDGPWVFGMCSVTENGKVDVRMGHVQRRDRETLRPIIVGTVAPGSIVISDEWRAYIGLDTWLPVPYRQYVHFTVNHTQNYVNPNNGYNTQRMETEWGHVKNKLLHHYKNVPLHMLDGHLAAYWWLVLHDDNPFLDMVEEIR